MADTERYLGRAAAARRSSKHVSLRDFDDLEIGSVSRNRRPATAIVVGPAGEAPLTLAGRGPLIRHGAKNEPMTRADLRAFIDRRLKKVSKDWLGGIKRVMTAPSGSEIVAIQRTEDEQGERAIRITTDENAPLYRAVDFDITHPYRQTELIPEVNRRLPHGVEINTHDLISVRRTHLIDHETQPDFVHRPRFGSNQYSDAFVDWLVEQCERDPAFFTKARERYHELRRARRSS